jgi:hypothetical protein
MVVNPNAPAPTGQGRYQWTQAGPMRLPDDMSDQDAAEMVRRYDAYVEDLKRTADESSGFARMVALRQLDDAVKGREVQREIADIQARSSRYGVDVTSRDRLRALKEEARQFDLKHGLEIEKVALQRAETATNFLATPDRYAQAGNFLALSGRVAANQPGGGTYGSAVAPRPNTMQDYAVLESGQNPYANRGSAVDAATGGGAGATPAAGGAGADARQKALKAIISGYTPSQGVGVDQNDWAVLGASHAIMNMNLNPQQQATIGSNKEYQAILGSNMKNLGANPDSWWQKQQQSLPGQGSARLA